MREPSARDALVTSLGERVAVQAADGEEVVVELGSVVLPGTDPRGMMFTVDVEECEGRANFAIGLRWPGEEPAWKEEAGKVRARAWAVPVVPDADGADREVALLVRLRPRWPSREATAWITSRVFPPPERVPS